MKNQIKNVIYVMTILFFAVTISSCEKDEITSSANQKEALDKLFSNYEIVQLNAADMYEKTKQSSIVNIPIESIKKTNWEVQHNDLFATDLEIIIAGQESEKLQNFELLALNSVEYTPSEFGNFVMTPDFFVAKIKSEDVETNIEPLQAYVQNARLDEYIVYKATDVIFQEVENACNQIEFSQADNNEGENAPTIGENERLNCWKMGIWADADYEFYKGKANSNYNLGVLLMSSMLSNTYSQSKFGVINLDFIINGYTVYTNPSAALYYPKSTNASTLLAQTKDAWNYFLGSRDRDLVILFTGKDMWDYSGTTANYSVMGIAYVGQICKNRSLSYAVVEFRPSQNNYLVSNATAHEIGHTLGGNHVSSGILYASVNTSSTIAFSSTSITQMNTHIWYNHACLSSSTCW